MTSILFIAKVLLLASGLVIAAVLLDLWDGIETSRALKQKVSSHRLRDSIRKILEYWRFLIAGSFIDSLAALSQTFQGAFITIAFAISIIAIEIKSMAEHAGRRKSNSKILGSIADRLLASITPDSDHESH